jgi:hypothetical protein
MASCGGGARCLLEPYADALLQGMHEFLAVPFVVSSRVGGGRLRRSGPVPPPPR